MGWLPRPPFRVKRKKRKRPSRAVRARISRKLKRFWKSKRGLAIRRKRSRAIQKLSRRWTKQIRGFPKEYKSPFRLFVVPVSRMPRRVHRRVFALCGVRSLRLYEGKARYLIIPFEMGTMTQSVAIKLTETDVREQWELRASSLRKLEMVKVYGFYALKSDERRKKIATRKLRGLFRARARRDERKRMERKQREIRGRRKTRK